MAAGQSGNALGAFLPLSYIRSHDPEGIVILWSVGPTGECGDSVLDRVQVAIDRANRVPDLLVGLECVDNPENGKEIWDWQGGVQSFQKERVTEKRGVRYQVHKDRGKCR